MNIWQSIALGILQGITEFLPVSSSGHLVLMRELFGIGEIPLLYDVLVHVATLMVVVIVFWSRIVSLVSGTLRSLGSQATDAHRSERRALIMLIVATAFTGAIGIGIQRFELRTLRSVGISLIVTGVILLVPQVVAAFRVRSRPPDDGELTGDRAQSSISLGSGVAVGVAQGLAVIPGISRSGATISTALLTGMERRAAGEFAFLVSIPAILGALVLTIADGASLVEDAGIEVIVAGVVAAFLVGLGALRLLLRIINAGRLHLFSWYVIPAGVVVLLVA